jgi:CubicO group peptidase (beta-lactamase class C family)
VGTTAERFAEAGRTLQTWGRDRDVSGAVLVTRGGEDVFAACVGYADRATRTPVRRSTRFGLASVNKMFTAVAVADLVASGSLTFSTPVVDLLPADRRPRALSPDVTVHHLLCHTSGIADYFEEDEDSPAYAEDYGALWAHLPTYTITRPADFLPLFADLPAYRPPGQVFQYCNAGYLVLGLVVEELTGRPYADVVQERVLDRAGMAATGFLRFDEVHEDVATGYLPRSGPDEPWRTNIYSMPVVGGADGGALSTLDDLDRFLRAYADGTLLGDLTEVMLTAHVDAGDGFSEGYGVHLYPDGRWGHGGGDPGVSAIANRWPEEDLQVVALCNVDDVAVEVRDLVLEAWRGA